MIRFFGAVLLLIGCGLPEAADPAFPLTAADAGELVARLRGLPDVTLTETTKPDPKQPAQARTFELWFAQPIDHDDPGQSKFRQRALLTLRYPASSGPSPATRGATDPAARYPGRPLTPPPATRGGH